MLTKEQAKIAILKHVETVSRRGDKSSLLALTNYGIYQAIDGLTPDVFDLAIRALRDEEKTLRQAHADFWINLPPDERGDEIRAALANHEALSMSAFMGVFLALALLFFWFTQAFPLDTPADSAEAASYRSGAMDGLFSAAGTALIGGAIVQAALKKLVTFRTKHRIILSQLLEGSWWASIIAAALVFAYYKAAPAVGVAFESSLAAIIVSTVFAIKVALLRQREKSAVRERGRQQKGP